MTKISLTSIRDQIRSARFDHLYFERTRRALSSQLTLISPGSVAAVVGPTRVGKSEAAKAALSEVFPSSKDDSIPYVSVDCSLTDISFVSTRYITLDLLDKLQHPFHSSGSTNFRHSMTETNARLQLRKAISFRDTKLIFLDEAAHLLRTKASRAREAALDSFKCLGNETGAMILLVGGYDLLKGCFSSAHLNGRLSIVEFPRYKPTAQDQAHFNRILATFDQILPWSSSCSLISLRSYIYAGTLGCCGLVSSWILLALAQMEAEGSSKLCAKHFLRCRFEQQTERIAEEIAYGESVLRPIENADEGPVIASDATPPTAGRKRVLRSSLTPGRRKPRRDPTGKAGGLK